MPKDRTQEDGHHKGTITIAKPNLAKEKYFNSKHTTPDVSIDKGKETI